SMHVFFIFSIIIFLFIIYTSTEMTGVCSNVSDRSLLKCCPNYRLVGSSCEECWSGTIGINCKDNCPPNYYGRLCLEKCGCQPCDRVKGCLNLTDNSSPANSALWITLSVLASCIVPCFIFCLRIFCILRQRMLTKKPSDLDEYENSRYSISKTPRTIDSSQTYDTETGYDKCQTTVSNNMTETTSRNDYGCDDSMDGAYNILKLTVSDKNEHMLIPNNTSSPLEIQKHTKVHEDTSQMASSVSNIVKTKNHESKPLIHREKKKHQKELLRALDEFKQGSTKERKKLRYSFTKSTELF
uniref:TNFR-Cys domain-containing protein n=1 Tax=Magallana gigas TaxID=29159 RepID=A0A8W8IRP2_MAGGI